MNNLEKYNKYKLKYLQLKNQMIGGKPHGPPHSRAIDLITLKNNGSRPEEPYLCQQCIWISIRDFLEYHRGINTTVRKLKESVGLGPETDKMEFDNDFNKTNPTNISYNSLIRLCQQLNITICLISISPDNTIYPISLNDDGKLANDDRLNDDPAHPENEEVYIASFGRHFELIVEGPSYKLTKYSELTTLEGTPYKPKIKVSPKCGETAVFVPVEELSPPELRLASYELELIDLKQELAFFNKELKRVESDLANYRTASKDLKNLKLDKKTEEILNTSNIAFIKELNAQQENINRQITRITGLITTKERELSDKTNDEESKARKTIEANKALIGSLQEDIKRLNQNIDAVNESKKIIPTLGLLPEQKGQFEKQSDDSIAKYKKDIAKITKQIEQLRDENETLGLLVNS